MNRLSKKYWLQRCVAQILFLTSFSFFGITFGSVSNCQDEAKSESVKLQTEPLTTAVPNQPLPKPKDGVLPIDRAWEFSHYRVRVWLCTDGSPEINGIRRYLESELIGRSEIADRSGWEFLVQDAPNPWNWRFSKNLSTAENIKGFESIPELSFDDKLMVVSISRSRSGMMCEVREFDLIARQWGSLLRRNVIQTEDISQSVFEMVKTAFMPIAQVDITNEKNEAVLRARAVLSCIRTRLNENGEWIAETNSTSPVFVQARDVFLPILRRTDRDGKLLSLDPVPFTFVTLDKIEGARIDGHVQSTVRAPLAARKSKRLQKLALVIRPPESSTVLKLYSKDDKDFAMEGIEVYSRPPNAAKDDASELLGKTDWRGLITIPPSPDGLRMLYLKRGARAMRKLPIVPGFLLYQETDVANDEARLFAEGIIQGIQIELIDLVTQRTVYEDDINKALENKDNMKAREVLAKYKRLPRPAQIQARLGDEQSRLRTRARDEKEVSFINDMFTALQTILSKNVGESRESDLLKKINETEPEFKPDSPPQ